MHSYFLPTQQLLVGLRGTPPLPSDVCRIALVKSVASPNKPHTCWPVVQRLLHRVTSLMMNANPLVEVVVTGTSDDDRQTWPSSNWQLEMLDRGAKKHG